MGIKLGVILLILVSDSLLACRFVGQTITITKYNKNPNGNSPDPKPEALEEEFSEVGQFHDRACQLPPVQGDSTCGIPASKFYYDNRSKKCRMFAYNGCNGNWNNFASKMECLNSCADCYEEPERGSCFSRFQRYHFEVETETCKPFIFAGCDGNRNNFETNDDCMSVCKKEDKPNDGPHRADKTNDGPHRGDIPADYFSSRENSDAEHVKPSDDEYIMSG